MYLHDRPWDFSSGMYSSSFIFLQISFWEEVWSLRTSLPKLGKPGKEVVRLYRTARVRSAIIMLGAASHARRKHGDTCTVTCALFLLIMHRRRTSTPCCALKLSRATRTLLLCAVLNTHITHALLVSRKRYSRKPKRYPRVPSSIPGTAESKRYLCRRVIPR